MLDQNLTITHNEEIARQLEDVMEYYNEAAEIESSYGGKVTWSQDEYEDIMITLTNNAWFAFITLINFRSTVNRAYFLISRPSQEFANLVASTEKEITYYTEELRKMAREHISDEENLTQYYPFNPDNKIEAELFNNYFHL